MAKKKKSSGKGGKAAKIKLTREQKSNVARMVRVENRISVCQDYIQHWTQFFRIFGGGLQNVQITAEHEKAFFQTVTTLARKHFLFCELMADTFEQRDPILEFLNSVVSLNHLKSLTGANLAKLESEWHSLLMEMNVGLGRLLRRLPPDVDAKALLGQTRSAAPPTTPSA